MTATPLLDPDPDDPTEILRALPEDCIEAFLAEYAEALNAAQDPAAFPALRTLLRLWRLRALMYSQPGYEENLAAARAGDWGEGIALEDLIAGLRPG